MYYINYFFLFSIIGHLFESILYLFHNGESGFLYGYWTPIYGVGIVTIIIIDNILKKYKLNRLKYIIYLFFISGIILTCFEFIGGNLLFFIFKKSFWSYTNHKYNIGKYISIEISLIWGLVSVLFCIFLRNLFDMIVKKIPRIISLIFIFLIIIDLFFSVSKK